MGRCAQNLRKICWKIIILNPNRNLKITKNMVVVGLNGSKMTAYTSHDKSHSLPTSRQYGLVADDG